MTIGIEHVNDYPLIRFEIRLERKFPIRRSLPLSAVALVGSHVNSVIASVPRAQLRYYRSRGGYDLIGVCLFVCLLLSSITKRKLLDRFS